MLKSGFWSILLVPTVFIAGCSTHADKQGQQHFELSKLAGRWEFLNNNTHQIEEWVYENDHELKGRGFVLENGDTTFIEILSIREMDGVLTYFAQVSDLSSAEIVPFKLSRQSADRIEFANESQDFPKKIGYEIKGENQIEAYIEGPREGNNVRITFDFIKK